MLVRDVLSRNIHIYIYEEKNFTERYKWLCKINKLKVMRVDCVSCGLVEIEDSGHMVVMKSSLCYGTREAGIFLREDNVFFPVSL